MKEAHEIVAWSYPVLCVVFIVVAATRRELPGKPWLIAHVAILLATTLAWRIPDLLLSFETLDFDTSRFYEIYALPLNIVGLAGFSLLFPFLFAVANSSHSRHRQDGSDVAVGDQHGIPVTGDTTNPLYGVHGWLKFLVVVNMYISPVLFGIGTLFGFIGLGMLADDYPGIVVVGLIESAVGVFLVVKWIMIARRLRDIAPGVVQEAKKWLLISLAWNVLSTPLVLMSGMDAEDVLPGAIRQLFVGIIAFAIWYSYFNVSKRVKATYPDWNK